MIKFIFTQLIIGFLLYPAYVQSQSVSKLYNQGMDALYEDNFKFSSERFAAAYEKNPDYEDLKFRRQLLIHLLDDTHDQPMDKLLALKNNTDHFFNYWVGRVYYNRGEPEKAIQYFKSFLNVRAYKSPQITEEVRYLINENQKIIDHFNEGSKIALKGKMHSKDEGLAVTGGELHFVPEEYQEYKVVAPVTDGTFAAEVVAGKLYKLDYILDGEILYSENFEPSALVDTKHLVVDIPEEAKATLLAKKQAEEKEALVAASHARVAPEVEEEDDEAAYREIDLLGSKYRRRNKIVANNVYFDFGTSHLSPPSSEVLGHILKALTKNPEIRIEIAGHTDNVGKEDFNEWLSHQRAESVKDWLVAKGVDGSRLTVKGYGERHPLASNDDEENGRELNRRIELLIVE